MSNVRVPPFGAAANNCTVSIAVTTTSGNQSAPFDNLLPQVGGAFKKSATVRLFNGGSNTVYYELVPQGAATVTASKTTSIPLPPNTFEKVSTQGATAICAVTDSGTSTLYATPGEGL
jgi:hypothetical protein